MRVRPDFIMSMLYLLYLALFLACLILVLKYLYLT